MKRHTEDLRLTRARQRGVTMVSVMLMTVSLMTLGLLAVRSSTRDATQAGQLVARERALMVAQAAVDLAAAEYIQLDNAGIDAALAGYNLQVGACVNECGDCIPDPVGGYVTGMRNEVLDGSPIDCGGRPCMRQGAVAFLNDSADVQTNWCDIPFRQLVPGGDAEARVSVWVRNNTSDALGPNGINSWIEDTDGRVVITASATLRNTVVTVEQEIAIQRGDEGLVMQPLSPDQGYGGGHNNDNSSVQMCTEDFVTATPS